MDFLSFFIGTNIIKLYQGTFTNDKHKTFRTRTTKDKGRMINKNDDLFHKLEVAESILGRIKVLHDEKMEKWQNSQNIKIKIGVFHKNSLLHKNNNNISWKQNNPKFRYLYYWM